MHSDICQIARNKTNKQLYQQIRNGVLIEKICEFLQSSLSKVHFSLNFTSLLLVTCVRLLFIVENNISVLSAL